MALPFKEYRCKQCRKLLFRGWLSEGEVEVKCKNCHALTTVMESKFDEMLCAVLPCPHRIAPTKSKK